jgi:hypothetical protein
MISVVGKVMASPAAIECYKNVFKGKTARDSSLRDAGYRTEKSLIQLMVNDVDRIVGRCHRPTISSRVWQFRTRSHLKRDPPR